MTKLTPVEKARLAKAKEAIHAIVCDGDLSFDATLVVLKAVVSEAQRMLVIMDEATI